MSRLHPLLLRSDPNLSLACRWLTNGTHPPTGSQRRKSQVPSPSGWAAFQACRCHGTYAFLLVAKPSCLDPGVGPRVFSISRPRGRCFQTETRVEPRPVLSLLQKRDLCSQKKTKTVRNISLGDQHICGGFVLGYANSVKSLKQTREHHSRTSLEYTDQYVAVVALIATLPHLQYH